jgi:hypothetical protein
MPSASTLKQYAMRMNILARDGVNPKNANELFAWFDRQGHGASSQKVYLSAIKNADPAGFPKILQDKLNELYAEQNKRDVKQVLTEKQQENFVKWTELLAVQHRLASMEKTLAQWRQYLVVSLYTLTPPVRADYGAMEVHARRDKSRTENELIWNAKPTFIFRKYKTAKTYGEVELAVPKALVNVIKEWFDVLGGVPTYLLGDTAMTPNTFAVYVARVFKTYTNKEVGISLIRHSYITHAYPSLRTIVQKQKLATQMLHSRDLQEKYISLKDMD